MGSRAQREAAAALEVEGFNRAFPVGTLVRYWRGVREGDPSGTGRTRSAAWLLSGHGSVQIEGTSGSIALTHVEPVETAKAMAALRAAGLRLVGIGSDDPAPGEPRVVFLHVAAREPGGDVLELARELAGGIYT